MKLKRSLIPSLIVFALSPHLFADKQPPTLSDFWKQWNQQRLEIKTPEAKKFAQFYGEQWSPAIIPVMIHDVQSHKQDAAEFRDYVIPWLFHTLMTAMDVKRCSPKLGRRLTPRTGTAFRIQPATSHMIFRAH